MWQALRVLTLIDRGDRALSSCLGGGDMDGDDFNVILDVSFSFLVRCFSAQSLVAGSDPPDGCDSGGV